MSINDAELIIAVKQMLKDAPSPAESMRDTLLKAVVGIAIPSGIGTVLTGIIGDSAERRWKERILELLSLFAERVAKIEDALEPRHGYGSEEFESLFIEAVDQQRTNTYQFKREMLAQGLANAGSKRFYDEREKQTFFRILRDLSPEDVHMLRTFSKPTNDQHMGLVLKEQTLSRIFKATAVDTRIYRLQGFGFVSAFERLPTRDLSSTGVQDIRNLRMQVSHALNAEPQVRVKISDFGTRFLAFLTAERQVAGAKP